MVLLITMIFVLTPNKDLGKALGRLFVVSTLLKTGELRQDDRIHLLGCAVPPRIWVV